MNIRGIPSSALAYSLGSLGAYMYIGVRQTDKRTDR